MRLYHVRAFSVVGPFRGCLKGGKERRERFPKSGAKEQKNEYANM